MASSIRTQALKSAIWVAGVIYLPFLFVGDFLLQLLPFWNPYGNISALFRHAVEFAILVAIGLSLVSYFAFRNLYDPDYSQSSAVYHSAYIDIRLPYQPAFDSCLASLGSLSKPMILLEDRRNGRIEASTRPANWWEYLWKSWGQRVSFRLGADQEGNTKILVTSRAALAGTMADTGYSKKNVESITDFLRKEVEK